MKILVTNFPPTRYSSCYIPQHLVLKPSQSIFFHELDAKFYVYRKQQADNVALHFISYVFR